MLLSSYCLVTISSFPGISLFSDKPGDSDASRREQKSDRGGKSARGKGRSNANANKKNNYIQTAGFLSEGIATVPVNRRTGDHYGGSSRGESNAAEILQKPRIVKRDHKPEKADLDAEQKALSDLLGDEEEEKLTLEDEDSKTSSSDDFLPIKIRDRKFAFVLVNVFSIPHAFH